MTTHVLVHVLEYADGGADAQKLAEGTRAECERIADLTVGIGYGGGKKVTEHWFAIVTAAEWQTALDEEEALHVRQA